ncbi:cyclic beta-1,2-glucan ABC transporter [Haematobacter massiliensis]|uniref:Cyclic beta-1,2-glucan ABC transporter n=2 Tax=Haematobacter massiliensis TaxID=195105 RepID=A0A086Y0D0_9RHOB|nr:glucan ABC transporter ATP-binding protein/ permease [Haematobacter massiliensis]KFI27730.1 cyclic beta-1,2-glucan ABC transporter [Haematobacter massiliensis]OWJ71858.1 cyclic beta-1,2-glucan ABC transporter [Haematobacter massiliensis]OWJ83106.1 cyclic beta-1,2-glucan ABC transporter [Haematobacter massiliensis]QBJ23922.1 glucan ABC transporter ATP-binding protein/ permease [Haematobacter massiliensis]
MTPQEIYRRTIALLLPERWLALALALSGVILAVVQLAEPILFGRMVDRLAEGSNAFQLIGIWAAFGLFGIVAGAVVAIASDRLAHRRRMAALGDAFSTAMTLPISYHARKGSGAVVRSILAGTDALFVVWLGVLREQLTALAGILLMIPTAIRLNATMAGVLALLGIVYLVLNVLVIRKTRIGQAEVEKNSGSLFGRVGDVLGNVTVVQSYSRFASEMQAMRGLIDTLLSAQYPVLTWWGLMTVLTRAAATITMVVIFGVGAVLAQRGEITVGQIVSFAAFAGLLVGQLDRLSSFVSSVVRQTPVIRSYFELLDARADVIDPPNATPLVGLVLGHVAYHHVTYRFPDSDQGVFDLTFEALPGQTVALVGPTGSGKTTTLALLQRLRQPDSGTITVDGRDIADITLSSLRDNVAVVFQEAGLFNRSIAENIRIGRPGATDAEVQQAAELAEAHEFIIRKPGGYGFVIGERGNALSGGERQRIAIARAVLKNAPILILDEATSALDPATEAKIKRAIDKLRANRTTLVIAHRLSTVANADRILVLDQGRIVEDGKFHDLAHAGGLFQHLVEEGEIVEPKED